jgi:hypothetical protein
VAVSAEPLRDADRARRTLGWSAAALLAGIALCATGQAEIGAWIAVAAFAGCVVGLHSFGRARVDAG